KFTNDFPGIPLNDFVWPAPFKPMLSGNTFPYGGFARVGDVMQVPFIGAYRVIDPSGPGTTILKDKGGNTVGYTSDTLVELNPVTMDVLYVNDKDTTNDAQEHLGRFCPF